jgi:hypothetical protein
MADPGLGLDDPPRGPGPAPPLAPLSGRGGGRSDAAVAGPRLLELKARPLRHDASGMLGQLLILMAVLLCPLLIAPWLWYRRERFRLNRCRVRVEGAALLVYHRQRLLLALDLRYASRHLTGGGDLVLSEEAAHYLALGVDPPEHGPPEAAAPGEQREHDGRPSTPVPSPLPARPERAGARLPLRSWRAVRLAQADLLCLRAAVSAVPVRQLPQAAEVWSLLQALGSVGATGRRVEAQLAQLVQADLGQPRPSSLLTMLHERAQEDGPAAAAARRVLGARALGPHAAG